MRRSDSVPSLCRFSTGIAIVFLLFAACLARPSRGGEGAAGYAELPGVKLWFTDSGGEGTPVILLHANTGTSAVWQLQAAALATAGYRAIAFDRRGWGKSMADGDGAATRQHRGGSRRAR